MNKGTGSKGQMEDDTHTRREAGGRLSEIHRGGEEGEMRKQREQNREKTKENESWLYVSRVKTPERHRKIWEWVKGEMRGRSKTQISRQES